MPQTWCWFTIHHFPRSNLIPYPDENLLGHHPTVGCLDSFHKPFGNLKYPQKPNSLVGKHFFSAGFWHLKLHNLHNTHHFSIFPIIFGYPFGDRAGSFQRPQACFASGMVRTDLKHGTGPLRRSVLEPRVQAALKEQGFRVQLDGKGFSTTEYFIIFCYRCESHS